MDISELYETVRICVHQFRISIIKYNYRSYLKFMIPFISSLNLKCHDSYVDEKNSNKISVLQPYFDIFWWRLVKKCFSIVFLFRFSCKIFNEHIGIEYMDKKMESCSRYMFFKICSSRANSNVGDNRNFIPIQNLVSTTKFYPFTR